MRVFKRGPVGRMRHGTRHTTHEEPMEWSGEGAGDVVATKRLAFSYRKREPRTSEMMARPLNVVIQRAADQSMSQEPAQ